MTDVINTLPGWQSYRASWSDEQSVGVVMTMGALHAGHQSLMERAVLENDRTILTIFVNPTQFNEASDFAAYQKTIESDVAMAERCGIDAVFVPSVDEIYPDNYEYQLQSTQGELCMEGAVRPGHFTGVLTVVFKLLCLVRATRAYFGEKDYQQLSMVEGMVSSFFLPVDIVRCETVRDERGVALSSRNARLSEAAYDHAVLFARTLLSGTSCDHVRTQLEASGVSVEYIEEHDGRRFGAVNIEGVRLIDNRSLSQVNEV